ncbi:MAG: hypothetical protein S4CHLAM81_03260 [Chlamydiales bacterium]|nr:hypothetical protein [Chlamydiales bacterium]MCH9635116.1 hypothetical protein [Chlamydiales bacterium]
MLFGVKIIKAPILFIPENHEDPIPKDFIRKMLPQLERLGFTAMAYESPPIEDSKAHTKKGIEIVGSMLRRMRLTSPEARQLPIEILIERLMREHKMDEVCAGAFAHGFRRYDAIIQLDRMFDSLPKGFDLVCIDAEGWGEGLNFGNTDELLGTLQALDPTRDAHMADQIRRMRQVATGIIVFTGANHVHGIAARLHMLGVPKSEMLVLWTHELHDSTDRSFFKRVWGSFPKDMAAREFVVDHDFGPCIETSTSLLDQYMVELPGRRIEESFAATCLMGATGIPCTIFFESENCVATAVLPFEEDVGKHLEVASVSFYLGRIEQEPVIIIPNTNEPEVASKLKRFEKLQVKRTEVEVSYKMTGARAMYLDERGYATAIFDSKPLLPHIKVGNEYHVLGANTPFV